MRPPLRVALATLALLPLPLAAAHAQAGGERGGFVVRLGNDTMVVERYVRSANRLEAWSVNRAPATVRRHLVVTLERGVPVRMEYEGGRVDGSQPPTKMAMAIGPDTTVVTITRNDSTQTRRVVAASPVPSLGNSFALMELAIARFLAARTDSTAVVTMPVGAPAAQPLAISRAGRNTLHVDYFGAPWVATVDERGRIVSVDGSRTAGKISVERVKDVDVEALTRDFAQRDREGRGMGTPSRADSVRAAWGDAAIAVDYSRPARRGRTLVGGIIPYDQVWRTGANAATMLTTTADLEIGGTLVPAGKYTLWTLPTRTGWQLIVNKQTGQWGTVYDASQDLARIPLKSEPTTTGPELFTIEMLPGSANTGTLRMSWGDILLSAPVVVKK